GTESTCRLRRGWDGLLEPCGGTRFDEQAIDNNFDGVVLALVELRRIIELDEFAIDAGADEAVLRQLLQFVAVGAIASADDGREDHDAIVGFAELSAENGLHNLFAGLARDGMAALGTMRNAYGGVDDAEIVVDFGDGADGGAWRARSGFLLDGDRGRETFDDVDFGALHLVEELASVRRERFDVTALP